MSLIDSFLARAVVRGELTVIHADGRRATFGKPDPALHPVTMRLASGAATAIMRDPSLGAAESFMDGKLVLEQGDIFDLLTLMSGNNPWERADRVRFLPGPLQYAVDGVANRLGRINGARRSKRNVAHHYDLSD